MARDTRDYEQTDAKDNNHKDDLLVIIQTCLCYDHFGACALPWSSSPRRHYKSPILMFLGLCYTLPRISLTSLGRHSLACYQSATRVSMI